MMMMMRRTRSALAQAGKFLNEAVSFVVFLILDTVDFLLCFLYKAADFLIESEWKSCYCLSAKEPITSTGKIIMSSRDHNGESSKILTLSHSKIQLEDISDTLYSRPSLLSELSKLSVEELTKRFQNSHHHHHHHQKNKKMMKSSNRRLVKSSLMVNSTVIEMLQGKIKPKNLNNPVSRWSDCDCGFCTSWANSSKDRSLYVKVQGPKDDNNVREDVLFIHGFISSSAFWTETVFPNLSSSAKSKYRLFAIDLLGFGRSPKPSDSLYTLKEHLEMIETSVLQKHKLKSFHVVAHSLGCILALGLAVQHPTFIKSLTLLAPPYYPVPKGEERRQYVMRKIAPRRVWPPLAFGASMACWYEHISRTICLLICKNHRVWEFLAKLITRNRIRTFLMEGFFCHTHNAAWHTLHNIICGTGSNLDAYLDNVRDNLDCHVTIFHGRDDELIPVGCSFDVQRRIPRARVEVVENKDHITLVVGRQKAFARELEGIWRASSSSSS